MVCLGSARKREHRGAPSGTRRTGTEIHLERPQANASAVGSVEQALRAELELARKDAALKDAELREARKDAELREALKDAELARKDAALKDAELREALKDAELREARKDAERKWLLTIKPALCVFALRKLVLHCFCTPSQVHFVICLSWVQTMPAVH